MMTTSLSNNKTFEEVKSEMEKAMVIYDMEYMHLLNEYSEWYHEKMLTIQSILSECTNDDMDIMQSIQCKYDINTFLMLMTKNTLEVDEYEELKAKYFRIKNIGLEIHNRGGFKAMQANFYVFIMFLIPRNDIDEVKKFKDLKYLWNGVGDWEE